MDERMKEIEGRWPVLWPMNRTAGELIDVVQRANLDIRYLLQKVKEFKTRVAELEEWCGSYKDI